ncbi:flagellar hook-basal body complex protein FliE [Phenylobacterium sp.]|jgi:flagellar hook-basal body complex protein FliE|uniref:flagellar hook-basal body complex protein FliE n=1 Tax=Phenylobacterium sp. TaxID=1871053 RepID=UPI002F3FB1D5
MMTALAVAKAYANVQKAAGAVEGTGMGGEAASGTGGFGDILKSAMQDTMKATKNAETQMQAQVQGKAQLIDVVTAVSSAEQSLNTVMAIRDQVISAYQEIMRMPI